MKMLQRLRKAEASSVGKEMAETLLIHDRQLNKNGIVDRYDEAHFAYTSIRQPIGTWSDVEASLTQYFSIRNLVLLLHANPNKGFLFGPSLKQEISLDEAAMRLRALQGKPEVVRVDLEGCNIGLDLNGVKRLGLALDADEIKATNHYHEFALNRLKASKGQVRQLDLELLRLRGYITTPGTDSLLELVKTKPVDQIVLLEWFCAHYDESTKDFPKSGEIDAKVFKPFHDDSRQPETIETQGQLEALQKDFNLFSWGEPIRPVRIVTIMLDRFRSNKPPVQRTGTNRQLLPTR